MQNSLLKGLKPHDLARELAKLDSCDKLQDFVMDGEGSKIILQLKEEEEKAEFSSYKDITPLDLPEEDEINLRKLAYEKGWKYVCLSDNEPPSRSISSNESTNLMQEMLQEMIALHQEQKKQIQALLQEQQNQVLGQQYFMNLNQEVGKRLYELHDECARRGIHS